MLIKIYLMIALSDCNYNFTNTQSMDTTIIGKAIDAKAGAIVMTSDESIYYVEGLSYWNKEVYGKKVKITGTLVVEETQNSHNLKVVTQKIVGKKKIIKKSKYIVIE